MPAAGLVAAAVLLRRQARWLCAVAALGGVLGLILFGVFLSAFDPTGAGANESVAGLIQWPSYWSP